MWYRLFISKIIKSRHPLIGDITKIADHCSQCRMFVAAIKQVNGSSIYISEEQRTIQPQFFQTAIGAACFIRLKSVPNLDIF